MDVTKFKKLENDSSIIEKHIKIASFGKNKFIYIPLVIGIILFCFLSYSIYENLTSIIGNSVIILLWVITIFCFGVNHK